MTALYLPRIKPSCQPVSFVRAGQPGKMATANDPPKKKMKSAQKYKKEYSIEFPVFGPSTRSDSHAFCTVCSTHISVAHGGRDDLRKHTTGVKHIELSKQQGRNKTVNSFFTSNSESLSDKVTRAEMLFSQFLVEHNVPIAVTDHVGPLFKMMFPDSEIAKKYGSARTKTSAIIKDLADSNATEIAQSLESTAFGLATDGTNDTDSKLYPVVVRYFDSKRGEIVCHMLYLPNLLGNSTGLFVIFY